MMGEHEELLRYITKGLAILLGFTRLNKTASMIMTSDNLTIFYFI